MVNAISNTKNSTTPVIFILLFLLLIGIVVGIYFYNKDDDDDDDGTTSTTSSPTCIGGKVEDNVCTCPPERPNLENGVCLTNEEKCTNQGKNWQNDTCMDFTKEQCEELDDCYTLRSNGTCDKSKSKWLNNTCLINPKNTNFVYYRNKNENFYRFAEIVGNNDLRSYDATISQIDKNNIIDIINPKTKYITDLKLNVSNQTCSGDQVMFIQDIRHDADGKNFTLCGKMDDVTKELRSIIKDTRAGESVNSFDRACDSPYTAIPGRADYGQGLHDDFTTSCYIITNDKNEFKPGLFAVQGSSGSPVQCPQGSTATGPYQLVDKAGHSVKFARTCFPN